MDMISVTPAAISPIVTIPRTHLVMPASPGDWCVDCKIELSNVRSPLAKKHANYMAGRYARRIGPRWRSMRTRDV
jgi:hypothetical protein